MNLVEVDVLFIAGPPPPPPNDVENDVNWAEPVISKKSKLRQHFWIFVEKLKRFLYLSLNQFVVVPKFALINTGLKIPVKELYPLLCCSS